jgi:hypothetical protein
VAKKVLTCQSKMKEILHNYIILIPLEGVAEGNH